MVFKKKILTFFSLLVGLLMTAVPVFAHATVKPNQVGVGAYQTFTLGVPNEKDNPTVSVRLLIPEGLKSVSPNVKPGWNISVKDLEIVWSGGFIPAGQRDDFLFSAQAPSSEQTLAWKAYQTYQSGEVVSWDQDSSTEEQEGKGPFSKTMVVNDLKDSKKTANLPLILSGLALLFSTLALVKQYKR